MSNIGIWIYDTTTYQEVPLLAGHRELVSSVSFSPDGSTIASGSADGTVLLWELSPSRSSTASDVNQDGAVNVVDLALVALQFGRTGQIDADVNGDGVVDTDDLIEVASFIGNTAQAPQAQLLALTTIMPADVTLTIYDTKGVMVRQLDLGYQPAGYYTDRSKAAYWDGCNENSESVARGVYFYQLRAEDYTALRRMVILK